MPVPESKFIGCLLGGAIGDALGMSVIDWTREQIADSGGVRNFGPSQNVRPFVIPVAELGEPASERLLSAGQWTDDTQLTLALADALIEEGGQFIPEAWAHKLVRWINDAPRGPGLSTLQAAFQLRSGAGLDEAADPDGAGCGPAARVAPIGLCYADDARLRHAAAIAQAEVTHGRADAHAASLAVAEAVALVAPRTPDDIDVWNGADFLSRIANTVRSASVDYAEFARCLDLATSLLTETADVATAVRILGTSAWSREAVPCALHLVARMPLDFEELLLNAVNETGGAVESIATIAGAVGGALLGVDALPERWRSGVEGGVRLISTAARLHRVSS